MPDQNDSNDSNSVSLLRADLRIVSRMIKPGSKVLDVGCGDGALLSYLDAMKQVEARGIELSPEGVHTCVKKGLSVVQGDADTDLVDYPTGSFDYIVLSQTLQATRHPQKVLTEMIRIARYAIVSIPNFGYWRVRLQLLLSGKMPRTTALGHAWYNTPNIHLCTIRDFLDTCQHNNIRVWKSETPDSWFSRFDFLRHSIFNLLQEEAIFLLSADPFPKERKPKDPAS